MFLINSERGEMRSGSDDKRMDVFGMRVFFPDCDEIDIFGCYLLHYIGVGITDIWIMKIGCGDV